MYVIIIKISKQTQAVYISFCFNVILSGLLQSNENNLPTTQIRYFLGLFTNAVKYVNTDFDRIKLSYFSFVGCSVPAPIVDTLLPFGSTIKTTETSCLKLTTPIFEVARR